MNQQRKEIIIKEIEYWKKNRLLKEQYCNYLLTLYSEGEYETSEQGNGLFLRKWLTFLPVLFVLILPILFLVIYFTELPFSLQTTLNLILMITSLVLMFFFIKKNRIYYTLFMVISFLFFFFISIAIVDHFFHGFVFIIEGTVIIHSVLWYILGRRFKLPFLSISGISGILVLFGFSII